MLSRRLIAIAVGLAFTPAYAHGAETNLAPYAQVEVAPVATWAYLANITLSVDRFQRNDGIYAAPYTAKILPYFLLNEKGMLRIKVPDETLAQLAQGKAIDFTGSAIREGDGKDRPVDGRATPVDAMTGVLKVRLFYTRHIVLVFTTTYRLPGLSPASVPVK